MNGYTVRYRTRFFRNPTDPRSESVCLYYFRNFSKHRVLPDARKVERARMIEDGKHYREIGRKFKCGWCPNFCELDKQRLKEEWLPDELRCQWVRVCDVCFAYAWNHDGARRSPDSIEASEARKALAAEREFYGSLSCRSCWGLEGDPGTTTSESRRRPFTNVGVGDWEILCGPCYLSYYYRG